LQTHCDWLFGGVFSGAALDAPHSRTFISATVVHHALRSHIGTHGRTFGPYGRCLRIFASGPWSMRSMSPHSVDAFGETGQEHRALTPAIPAPMWDRTSTHAPKRSARET